MSSVRCEQLSLPRPQEISALLSTQLGIFMIQAKDSKKFSENLTRLSSPVPLQSTQLNRRFLSSTCCQECRVRENKCSTRCPRAWALSAIIVWAVGSLLRIQGNAQSDCADCFYRIGATRTRGNLRRITSGDCRYSVVYTVFQVRVQYGQ